MVGLLDDVATQGKEIDRFGLNHGLAPRMGTCWALPRGGTRSNQGIIPKKTLLPRKNDRIAANT